METFVVATVDEDGKPTQFWDGTALHEDLQNAQPFLDKGQARVIQGRLQSQFFEEDYAVVSVSRRLELT
jgi:single-stranded DNA-binding protein